MANLLLVNDTSTSQNQGCQATMHMMNRCLDAFFPEDRISRVYLTTINYPFKPEEAEDLLPSNKTSMEAALARVLASDMPVLQELRDAIKVADLVVINGEGSVLELQRNALMVYMIIELTRHYGVECHLINFTAHLTKPDSIELARRAFAICKSVCVREPLSYHCVRAFEPRVKLFPDIVAGMDVGADAPGSQRPYVMLGGGSATLRMRSDAKMNDLKERMRLISQGLTSAGLEVRLMGWFRDEWMSEITGRGISYHVPGFKEYFRFCSSASANFTGRHHGCVMSFAALCPFLTTTANCFKNFGDRLLYGSLGPVMEMEKLDVEGVVSLLRHSEALREERQFVLKERRARYEPFFFGSLKNIVQETEDLVDSGVFRLPADPAAVEFTQASTP